MFSIGEFARLGAVSIRTLRHYDEIGLPALLADPGHRPAPDPATHRPHRSRPRGPRRLPARQRPHRRTQPCPGARRRV